MKLLLVGGTGVLSTAITREALKHDIEVYMINRGHHVELIPPAVHLLKADIHDEKKVTSLLEGLFFDVVIDCICFTKEQIEYSFNLFKGVADQYIFISSCAVYNTQVCDFCTEDSPKVLPMWGYSVDKVECEEFLIDIAHAHYVNFTIIRPCVTYGDTRIPYGIAPQYGYHWTLVERIMNGKPIITWNGGNNKFNITRVEDFAIGVVGLLGNPKAYNEAFNIVGDETPTWNDVLKSLSKLLDKEVKTVDLPSEFYAKEIPSRRGEILGGRSIDSINSNDKIKSVVENYAQNLSLEDGLKLTLDYYKAHDYLNGIDYAFDGDTDRIICKYTKANGISTKDLNLHFINYFNDNALKNRHTYFINRYKDNFLVKLYTLAFRAVRKIFR